MVSSILERVAWISARVSRMEADCACFVQAARPRALPRRAGTAYSRRRARHAAEAVSVCPAAAVSVCPEAVPAGTRHLSLEPPSHARAPTAQTVVSWRGAAREHVRIFACTCVCAATRVCSARGRTRRARCAHWRIPLAIPSCSPMDGVTVTLEELFYSPGRRAPGGRRGGERAGCDTSTPADTPVATTAPRAKFMLERSARKAMVDGGRGREVRTSVRGVLESRSLAIRWGLAAADGTRIPGSQVDLGRRSLARLQCRSTRCKN